MENNRQEITVDPQNRLDEILAKFPKEFLDKYQDGDAIAHRIVNSLINGGSPYDLINEMLSYLTELKENFKKAIENQPPPRILLADESNKLIEFLNQKK